MMDDIPVCRGCQAEPRLSLQVIPPKFHNHLKISKKIRHLGPCYFTGDTCVCAQECTESASSKENGSFKSLNTTLSK